MNMVLKKISIIIILAFVFIPFGIGYGQFPDTEEELTITMSPQHPKGGESVAFSLISNLSGLEEAFITWSKNGVVEKSATGLTRYQMVVGDIGNSSLVKVVVTRESGVSEASLTIRPGEVYLIWEADSYTPPLYKGKALASHQSKIKVVAIPDLRGIGGGKMGSNSLLYEWSLDGKVDGEQSGVGKNIFSFRGPLVSRPKTVSLLVTSDSGNTSARSDVTINFIDPVLVLYKKNPLTGIKNNLSLNTGFVEESESTFIIEPYFFSEESFSKNLLDFRWVVDGNVLDILNKSMEIIFSGKTSGKSTVSVRVSNPNSLLQTTSKRFNIIVSDGE
jgi:hypothetical protein